VNRRGKLRTPEVGGFEDLARRPGVTVTDTAALLPGDPRVRAVMAQGTARARIAESPTILRLRAQRVQIPAVQAEHNLSNWNQVLHAKQYENALQVERGIEQFQAAVDMYQPGLTETPLPSAMTVAYGALQRYEQRFRRDALVQLCLWQLAEWSTRKGWDIVIESTDESFTEEQQEGVNQQYTELRQYIDQVNRQVGLKTWLKAALVRAKVYGMCGFEIVTDKLLGPIMLIPKDCRYLLPNLNEDWELQGFDYRGQPMKYQPGQVLWFRNHPLEGDWMGLSDLEPLWDILTARASIIQDDIPEACVTLWAGMSWHTLDVSQLPPSATQADIQGLINSHIAQVQPGKTGASDSKWKVEEHDIHPDLNMLIHVKESLDIEVARFLGVPNVLLNLGSTSNRAVAYAEIEAFVDGPISVIQEWFSETLRTQWYEPLLRQQLNIKAPNPLPIRVNHRWKIIRTTDFQQLIQIASGAYQTGLLEQPEAFALIRDGEKFDIGPEDATEQEPEQPAPPVKPPPTTNLVQPRPGEPPHTVEPVSRETVPATTTPKEHTHFPPRTSRSKAI
jgi:hypothetical protein